MKEKLNIQEVYDHQANAFNGHANGSFTWEYFGRRILDKHVNGFENPVVLDQGSGGGRTAQYLIERGVLPENITGVELSPRLVAIAKRSVPGVDFIVGDLTEVKTADDRFDIIIRHMVDEYLDNDGLLDMSVRTIDSMKPGGFLVAITTLPYIMRTRSQHSKLDTIFEEGWFEAEYPWGEKGPNFYREEVRFRDTLELAGFRVDHVGEIGIPREAEGHKKYEVYKKAGPSRLLIKATKP